MSDQLIIDDCWNRIGVRGDRSCERLTQFLHCRNCPVHTDAAQRIMQRRAPAGHADDWAASYAAPAPAVRGDTVSHIVFRIGQEWLALPTACSTGIAPLAPVHRLPHRSNEVLTGVVNVDGKLVAQLSLAALLTIDDRQVADTGGRHVYARLMVLQLEAHAVAVPVHEVHGIVQAHADYVQPLPATVNRAAARFLRGVLTLGALQVGVLDDGLLAYNILRVLR
jgi:chemotaxis-related protein WspD